MNTHEGHLILLVLGAVVAITITAVAWTLIRERRRSASMAATAQRMGFSFEPEARTLPEEGLSQMPVFALVPIGQGKLSNLVRGEVGSSPFIACDYHYWTGSASSNRSDHKQTVFCFPAEDGGLPDFILRPRMNVVDRKLASLGLELAKIPTGMMKKALGNSKTELLKQLMGDLENEGIEFGEHPVFSARYELKGPEQEALRRLFASVVLDFFAEQQEPLPCVEKAGKWLVTYRKGRLVTPAELWKALSDANSVRSLFLH